MKIRPSAPSERTPILDIHKKAFGPEKGEVIAALAGDLFDDPTAEPILSLVAQRDNTLVGHILFTKALVIQSEAAISAQILAPLAILPESQKCGIGQQLIHEGLRRLKAAGVDLVFVLGHPGYYPRCGFAPAGVQGFDAPYPIPEAHSDAWMVQELNGNFLGKTGGRIQCSKVLNAPQHWRE